MEKQKKKFSEDIKMHISRISQNYKDLIENLKVRVKKIALFL